jgi:hypothetical protein
MPDPVSAVVAAASSPLSVAAGLSAMAVAAFGVDAQALAVALIGTVLNLPFVDPAPLVRATARFCAAVCFSAVVGSAIGHYAGLPAKETNAVICVLASVLHGVLSWLGSRIKPIGDAGLKRVGVDVGAQ